MDDNNWHLDKKVPIGIIVTLVVQTIVFSYFFAAFITATNSRLSALEKTEDARTVSRPINLDRITRLEEKSFYIEQSLKRIEDKLDKVFINKETK